MATRTENRDGLLHRLWRFTRRVAVVFYGFHTAFLVGFTGQKDSPKINVKQSESGKGRSKKESQNFT